MKRPRTRRSLDNERRIRHGDEKEEDHSQDEGGIGPLHFFGEQQRPDPPDKVLERRFELGDRKIPAELQRLRSRLSSYVYASERAAKPDIEVEQLETEKKSSLWRVDLPVDEKGQRSTLARFGQTAIRQDPAVFPSRDGSEDAIQLLPPLMDGCDVRSQDRRTRTLQADATHQRPPD
jgi:hypothetical protein